jgi:uncharacterized repeat protein (TIGR04042 family)
MPAVTFRVRWPDMTASDCYSPSTVIKDFLRPGDVYPLADFVERTQAALTLASERVQAKYGFACSAAADQLREIQTRARQFALEHDAQVTVESFNP